MLIPSKTFLLGEYLAIQGGPAILALTEPCFSIDMDKRLHPDCMAARLWQDCMGKDCEWGLQDPYQGRGGMGASSAEFVMAYQQIFPQEQQNIAHLRDIFFQYVDKHATHQPSGYDVMAQLQEGIVFVHKAKLESLSWPFQHLGFMLVHTGHKLKTHEHLSQGQWSLDEAYLTSIVSQAQQSLFTKEASDWVQAIQHFHQALLKANLVAAHTQRLLTKLMYDLPIVAAKGCGAMGADVLLLLLNISDMRSVKAYLDQEDLKLLATHQQIYRKKL